MPTFRLGCARRMFCMQAGTLTLPVTGVGRPRVTVLVRCALFVYREGAPVVMWIGLDEEGVPVSLMLLGFLVTLTILVG